MLTLLGEEKKMKEILKSIKPVKWKAVSWTAFPQPHEAQEESSPLAQ